MIHIHDNDGVQLQVEYTIGNDGVLTFESIRPLDSDYRPCGPDLCPMFQQLYVVREDFTAGTLVAEPLLSALVTEINNSDRSSNPRTLGH